MPTPSICASASSWPSNAVPHAGLSLNSSRSHCAPLNAISTSLTTAATSPDDMHQVDNGASSRSTTRNSSSSCSTIPPPCVSISTGCCQATGLLTSGPTLSRAVARLGWTRQEGRWQPASATQSIDPARLIVIDETSTDTAMLTRYARSARGQRAHASAPRN